MMKMDISLLSIVSSAFIIGASGVKVRSAEVESMLYVHPDIPEAARNRAVANGIVGRTRQQMAIFNVPNFVEFVESLPKSGTERIRHRFLLECENTVDTLETTL